MYDEAMASPRRTGLATRGGAALGALLWTTLAAAAPSGRLVVTLEGEAKLSYLAEVGGLARKVSITGTVALDNGLPQPVDGVVLDARLFEPDGRRSATGRPLGMGGGEQWLTLSPPLAPGERRSVALAATSTVGIRLERATSVDVRASAAWYGTEAVQVVSQPAAPDAAGVTVTLEPSAGKRRLVREGLGDGETARLRRYLFAELRLVVENHGSGALRKLTVDVRRDGAVVALVQPHLVLELSPALPPGQVRVLTRTGILDEPITREDERFPAEVALELVPSGEDFKPARTPVLLQRKADLKSDESARSKTLRKLAAGDAVVEQGTYGKVSEVVTLDGVLGYVPIKALSVATKVGGKPLRSKAGARRTATGWYFPACDLADRLGFTVSGLSGETRLSRGTLRLELRLGELAGTLVTSGYPDDVRRPVEVDHVAYGFSECPMVSPATLQLLGIDWTGP